MKQLVFVAALAACGGHKPSLGKSGADCGTAQACTDLGDRHSASETDPHFAPGLAAAYYARGCEQKGWQACHRLAHLFMMGWGVEKSLEKSLTLNEAACSNGHANACETLAFTWSTAAKLFDPAYTDNLPANASTRRAQFLALAVAYLNKACNFGGATACYVATYGKDPPNEYGVNRPWFLPSSRHASYD